MVSKMTKAVALGLVPGSQGRVLAVPLPRMGSAVAPALGLLQVGGCNPRCWRGRLCRGVTPLTALPVLRSKHRLVRQQGLEALGGFTTPSLLFTGALFALPEAGER